MRPRHDARLVPAALVAYVAAATLAGGVLDPLGWALAAAAGAALLAISRRRGAAAAWLACAVAAAVAVAFLAADAARSSGGMREAVGSGVAVTVEGTIATEPEPLAPSRYGSEERRWRAVVDVSRWRDESGRWRPSSAQVIVIGGVEWASIAHGDGVRATGELAPTRSGRPIAVCWRPDVERLRGAVGVAAVVAELRSGLRDATAGLPDPVRGLTTGIVIGDTSGMDGRQIDDMRTTGLAHLTAVSGAHFAIVALVLGAAVRAARWPRRARSLALAGAAAFFVALVFPGASVVRAAWMCGVIAAALWWGRPSQALPSLASAVIGLLLVDPFLALSYGFALSVLATGAIALWSPILAVSLARVVVPGLARVIAVPLSAQIACAPVIVLMNPGVGLYSVPANLVALPFVALTTVAGLAALVVSPVSGLAAHVLARVAAAGAWPIAKAASAFAHAPLAWLPWPPGAVGAALAAMASAAVVVSTSARRVGGWARIGLAIALFAIVGATPEVRAAVAEDRRSAPDDWAVAACDVGQGDAMLLRAGEHSAVVIDVGPPDGGVDRCLRRHGVREVPLLVLTHPHADHEGGIDALLATAAVGEAWVSKAAGASDRGVSALDAAGVPWSVPAPGTAATVGAVRLAVWHDGSATARTDSEVNDSSLVVWGQAGGVTVLALGDVEDGGQARFLASGRVPVAVDVVKVAHHGSARQLPALAEAARARIAVVSVGVNPYGHPAPETIAAYERAGAEVLRTDRCGDVDIVDGASLAVSSRCPRGVAGWAYGGAERGARDGEGVGPGDSVATRASRRPRDHPRGAGYRVDRGAGARDRGERRRHPPERRVVRPRGPPRGHQPVPLRRAGRRRGRGGGGDERRLPRGRGLLRR